MTCAFCSGSGIQGMDAYGTRVPCRHCAKSIKQEAEDLIRQGVTVAAIEAELLNRQGVTLADIEAELKRRGETTTDYNLVQEAFSDTPAPTYATLEEAKVDVPPCKTCGETSTHTWDNNRLCCACYVAEGGSPFTGHPACLRAWEKLNLGTMTFAGGVRESVSPTVGTVPDPTTDDIKRAFAFSKQSVERMKAWDEGAALAAEACKAEPAPLISTITLKPGDRVVVHVEGDWPLERSDKLRKSVAEWLGINSSRVCVMANGMRLSVVSTESE